LHGNLAPGGAIIKQSAANPDLMEHEGRAVVFENAEDLALRISDGRMSGTAAGTIVLHVTPESAIGGPLAIVRTGDRIRLSVAQRSVELLVSDEEIATRLAALPPREAEPNLRGYRKLFLTTITQADEGCDFDFLKAPQTVATVPGNKP
jgi:dihydroxy-acid dehydratase